MLDAQKQYIVNLANLGTSKEEQVGELAMFTRSQLEKGITLPVGFVLTTTAFDDFLIANDLVDEIGPLINGLDYSDLDTVKKTSDLIRQAFQKATFPDIIKQPLKKAYAGLSGFAEVAVNIRVSPINDELGMSIRGGAEHFFGITGFETLLAHIKEVWADFFSPNALLYRGKIGYEGYLTEAIIIQKMVHAEVSGRIYTINPTDNDPTVMEIQAFWGIDDGKILDEIVPDSYLIDKRSGDVLEKKVVSQDYMIVRKSKSDPGDEYMKVKISPVWQKRAKLDDRHLYLLFDYASRVAQLKEKPQEIYWCLESGRVYFLDNKDFDVDLEASMLYPLKPSIQRVVDKYVEEVDVRQEPDLESYVEEVKEDVKSMKQEEVVEENKEEEKVEKENASADAVAEAQEEKVEPQEELEPEKEVKEEEKAEPEIVEEKAQEEAEAYEEEVTRSVVKDIPDAEDRVVVDIQPLKNLTSVLKGKGYLEKVRFGLAHFVFADYDLEDLTGDEILVLKELKTSDVPVLNSVKGAVIEAAVDEKLVEAIRVPIIHGIKNAFEILHDKEVITLDPQEGQVYLGAGVRDVNELKIDRRGMVDSTMEKAQQRLSSKLPVTVYENENNVPIKTTGDFWQYLYMNPLQVEKRNSQGYYIPTSDMMRALGYSPVDMMGNKQLQEKYITEAAALIVEVLSLTHARHIILQSATADYKAEMGIEQRGLELLNIDLELILRLRNKENIRNVWLALGDVKNELDLIEAKKEITAGGMRRSSSFKLLSLINTSYAGLAVKSLVENSNVDGVIVDLDELVKSFGVGGSKLDNNLANFVRYILEIVNTNNAVAFLIYRGIEVSNDQIKLFLDHGLTQFIAQAEGMVDKKLQVSDMELLRITKKKKRGRKRKKIDFGF
jgi:phosphoenolpyruvate synthase/pyruvate phosphate dikinase